MDTDVWTSREELRAGFAKHLQEENHEGPARAPSHSALTALYRTLKNTIGVEEKKIRGTPGFRGVRLPKNDPQ